MGAYTFYKKFERYLREKGYYLTNEDRVHKTLNFVKREFEDWCEAEETPEKTGMELAEELDKLYVLIEKKEAEVKESYWKKRDANLDLVLGTHKDNQIRIGDIEPSSNVNGQLETIIVIDSLSK